MNRLLVCLAWLVWLSACEPKAPDPTKPPLPNTATTLVDAADRPSLKARIQTGDQHTEYRAYFDGAQLTEIKEADATYHYRGARLLKYTQSSPQGTTLLELDDQGRVVRATNGGRALAQTDIDAIRTRAQLLRSHALAQQASRSHAP
jgi:hypothetical protein